MRLTGYTDYALRLLMYLGRQRGRLVTVQEIATAHGISEHHLRKVAHRLGQAGLVATWRGRAGGLRLAQPGLCDIGHSEASLDRTAICSVMSAMMDRALVGVTS